MLLRAVTVVTAAALVAAEPPTAKYENSEPNLRAISGESFKPKATLHKAEIQFGSGLKNKASAPRQDAESDLNLRSEKADSDIANVEIEADNSASLFGAPSMGVQRARTGALTMAQTMRRARMCGMRFRPRAAAAAVVAAGLATLRAAAVATLRSPPVAWSGLPRRFMSISPAALLRLGRDARRVAARERPVTLSLKKRERGLVVAGGQRPGLSLLSVSRVALAQNLRGRCFRVVEAVAGGSAAAALGLGVVQGAILALRRGSLEERKAILSEENSDGLKAICLGLRLRTSGKQVQNLKDRIIKALEDDDVNFAPDKPIGRMIQTIGGQARKNVDMTATLLGTRQKVVDLKNIAKILRLPVSKMNKKELATSIVSEMAMLLNEEAAELPELVANPSPLPRAGPAAAEDAVPANEAAHVANGTAAPLAAATPLAPEVVVPQVIHSELESQGNVVQTTRLDAGNENVLEKKERRWRERRMKLAGYMAEELTAVFGPDQQRYIQDMSRMLKEAPPNSRELYIANKMQVRDQKQMEEHFLPKVLGQQDKVPEYGSWHAEEFVDRMVMVGEVGPSRQAFCSWWDANTGCGELVDVDDQREVAVVSSALQTGANVSPRLKYLRPGEFVEYRRVTESEESVSKALLVRGIKGWPLMCEVGLDD